MALAMQYINEVLRQFDTTVIVDQEQWTPLMKLLKFEVAPPFCVLDRMTLRPMPGGFESLVEQLNTIRVERDQLVAQLSTLKAEWDQLAAKQKELEQQLESATAPKAQAKYSVGSR